MELLHTMEEIIFFDNMDLCANELEQLSKRYKQCACADLANEYRIKVKEELNKYSYLVGKKVTGNKKSLIINNKESFVGTIQEITHFNAYSKSVRCKIKYNNGGWDGFALKGLTLIEE